MTNPNPTPTTTLGPRYAQAVTYAATKHATQVRKSTSIPYVSHLLAVSALVLEAGGDEDQAIAALLHDAPEDQGGQPTLDEIREIFGARVANIVEGCSDSLAEDPEDKEPWRIRKERYLAHLEQADEDTLLVSLADKLHNARAIVSDLRITGPDTWNRFNAEPHEIFWYYRTIGNIARRRSGNDFLTTNLIAAYADIREHGEVEGVIR
jgi:(p)ppGpp synthase/HD superfamily hydrolase